MKWRKKFSLFERSAARKAHTFFSLAWHRSAIFPPDKPYNNKAELFVAHTKKKYQERKKN
jgi:hypothetical protein